MKNLTTINKEKCNKNIYHTFLTKLDESDISLDRKIVVYQYLSSFLNKKLNLNKSFNTITVLFAKLFITDYNFLIEYILHKYLDEQEHKCNINKNTETCKKKCPNLRQNIKNLNDMNKPPLFNKDEFNNKKSLIIKLLNEYYKKKCSYFGKFF